MTRDNDPPARIYLQWVGDEDTGIGHNRPEAFMSRAMWGWENDAHGHV